MNRPPEGTTPGGEHLTGTVERVTFHDEESGFCVVQVRCRGFKDLVTVVGRAPRIGAGEYLDAEGAWVIDPKHGQQFKASELRVTYPDSLEGIRKYLASGQIRGIGEYLAGQLVSAFGKGVFEVIEKAPRRLLKVPGIGKVRQAMIVAAFKEQAAVREIMVFLQSHSVSTAKAFRIYKTYGDTALEAVRADPYRLARDIRGIGFATADQIALALGFSKDSEFRARAGLEHILQELTEAGHCAYGRDTLLEKTARDLAIPGDVLVRALGKGFAEGSLVERLRPGEEPLVYLARLDFAERILAENLRSLALGHHPCPAVHLERAVLWVEKRVGLTLAPAQREALAEALKSKVMVITGGPGVGKTTLVNAILQVFLAKRLGVVLCAPTGRAAKRLQETSGVAAKTVHRLLEVDPVTGIFKRNRDNPLKGDVFVVDETSMMDLPLMHHLVRALPPAAALVLVGDVDQLPSVGPGCVLKDLIDSGCLPVRRLTEVFRQAAESAIVTNAHRINRGLTPEMPPRGEAEGPSDFYLIEAEEPGKALRVVLKLVQESIPRRFGLDPMGDIQVLTPMQRGEIGARNLNQVLQGALNPDGPSVNRFGWTFRLGDRVMQILNNYDKDVFNGDLGRISRLVPSEQVLSVTFDDREVSYTFGELDELVLCYATTIHKSQGCEFPAVIVPVHTQHYIMLYRNLLYTAITRARRLVVLVGTRQAIAIAAGREDTSRRITTLKERLREAFRG